MYPDSDSLAFVYSKYYKLFFHYHPNPKNALMIGGGAYSVPKYFQKAYPQLDLDVVEIDPALTEISKKEFRFQPSKKVKTFHNDGRIFLNQNRKKYDVIMGDAYRSLFSIPFHLVSVEAFQKMKNSLTEDGVLIINILSPLEGGNQDLLFAMLKTCHLVFPKVKVFKPNADVANHKVQNLMLVCFNKANPFQAEKISPEMAQMLSQEVNMNKAELEKGLVLSDDFSPVEHFAEKMLSDYFKR
jgi:spermidine synthase